MDLLTRLEQALESVVEGVFSRVIKTQLQPIEVARRLTREVENHRTVSVNTVYVPNVYLVHLPTEAYTTLQPMSGRLLGELEQYLREFTAERHYQTVGSLAVRLLDAPELKPNEMRIDVANEPAAVPSTPQIPAVLQSFPARGGASNAEQERTTLISTRPTRLEIIAGEGSGQQIPLVDGFTIGRGPTNSLSLADSSASRRHASIVLEDEIWRLHDQGSTNGTIVNEHRVTEHALRVGDIIQIGQTKFKVL